MSAETALWSRDSWESDSDSTLLTRAREGSAEAYGELWRRHLPAAYGVAGKHGGRTPPEDIVAEAATKIFALLQVGRGPDEHFRAYFLTTVRTVAADHTRRELRVAPVADDDLEPLLEPAEAADGGDAADGAGGVDSDLFDTELVRTAFSSLPERDQQVLWHTTVEGETPRVVAPQLGMTAGAVSSRAMRARESLRAGYLDAYAERCLAHAESRECTWTIERLGRLVRGRLPRRQTERAEAHVAACPHAAAVVADLREIHRGFPALVVPLVLAAGFGSSGLAAALGFAGAGVAGAGAAALAALGEVPVGAGAGAAAGAAAGATGATTGAAPTAAAAVAANAGQVAAGGAAAGGAAAGAAAAGGAATGGAAVGGVETGGSASAGAVAAESSQLASRLAVGLAAGVVAVGLVAATLTAGQSDAPAPPVAGPIASTPSGSTGSETTPTSGTSPTSTTSPTTTAGATETQTAASVSTSGTVRSRAAGSAAAAPRPTSASAGLPPASGVDARLLGAGDPTRISLRVPGASSGGSMTVTVSTASGAGSLSAGNRTFTCSQRSRSSVTCVGDGGQIQLVQSGTSGAVPLVVRVRDASGAVTQSVVVPA